MKIDNLFLIQGIFVLIFVFLTMFIGILIISKYFKYYQKNLIFVGIAWLGMAAPWTPELITFFIVITNANINNDVGIFIYIFLNILIVPIFITLWLIAFTNLLSLKKKIRSLILILSVIFSIVLDVTVFYFYFTNLSLIGKFSGPFMIEWTLTINVILIICLLIILTTGLLFAKASLKSSTLEIKLKGKLLLIAFILYAIGAVIDAVLTDLISNVISRSILAVSSILFYIGYILPEWAKNMLLKKE